MKIALVHDFLSQDGGAERVLKIFQEMWPLAPTFVLFYDQEKMNPVFQNHDLRPTFLQYLPGGRRHYQWYLPLMPHATERHDLRDFDVVISSSSAFAKGVITSPDQTHICYCHTPTRFLWSDAHSYVEELPRNWLIKKIVPLMLTRIRLWDRLSADRVDNFIANSETVRTRIKKYYGREATVIHPPVETQLFSPASPALLQSAPSAPSAPSALSTPLHSAPSAPKAENYFLTGGRLVSYKRFDIVINAFNRLGLPLKIFGIGPALDSLRDQARPNIEFVGRVTDEERSRLYQGAAAFINPQLEDFGITAIESMSAGRPVIAYAAGGALETVQENVTGSFFKEQTWENLLDAVLHFTPEKFDPAVIAAHAEKFSVERFKKEMMDFVNRTVSYAHD